jgi:hypothetical protein
MPCAGPMPVARQVPSLELSQAPAVSSLVDYNGAVAYSDTGLA